MYTWIMSKNIIALSVIKTRPHYLQCTGCSGWFDPYTVAPMQVDGALVCPNCAHLAGLVQCTGCNDVIPIAEAIKYKTDTFCEDCATEGGLDQCTGCNEWSPDTVECDSENYCEDCRERYDYYMCGGCRYYTQNTIYVEQVGESYCEDCFNDGWAFCSSCDDIYDRDDLTYNGSDYLCSDCMPTDESWGDCTDCDDVGSDRRFGVELETSTCPGWGDYSHDGWQAKVDVTVTGMEFCSRILQGNEGLMAIDDLCQYATKHDWGVDTACGYHLHLDMRDESIDGLKAIAFAYHSTYDVWKHFAHNNRLGGSYSKPLEHSLQTYLSCGSLAAWNRFSLNIRRRYQWANWRAYCEHTTLEIRLLEGTLDVQRIQNWVRAHTTFCDWASDAGVDGVKVLWGRDPKEQFSIMRDIWSEAGCYDLNEYYVCEGLREYAYV